MKKLIVEGWRTSPHSYALANQHQLLQLLDDDRFEIAHRDMPFFQAHWASVDSGLPAAAKARLAAIPVAAPGAPADIIYRTSFPFRMFPAEADVFVFATGELSGKVAECLVGADGERASARPESVQIITTSMWSRRALGAGGMPLDRVHVVPLGFDPVFCGSMSPAERAVTRRELGIGEGSFVFLNVGSMTWNKGIGPLLAAFAIHRRTHRNAVLLLKGGDTLYGGLIDHCIAEARKLTPAIQDPGLVEAIRYVGHNLSVQDLARVYQASDAYVSPYRAEGFNLPVLEAMASGLPVLVTEGGASDDYCPAALGLRITADRIVRSVGEHLEPRLESIVEQMARIASEPDARQRLSEAAAQWARKNYPWSVVSGVLAQVLLGERVG